MGQKFRQHLVEWFFSSTWYQTFSAGLEWRVQASFTLVPSTVLGWLGEPPTLLFFPGCYRWLASLGFFRAGLTEYMFAEISLLQAGPGNTHHYTHHSLWVKTVRGLI